MAQFEITQHDDRYSFTLIDDDGTTLARGPHFANADEARAGIEAVQRVAAAATIPFPGEDDGPVEELGHTKF